MSDRVFGLSLFLNSLKPVVRVLLSHFHRQRVFLSMISAGALWTTGILLTHFGTPLPNPFYVASRLSPLYWSGFVLLIGSYLHHVFESRRLGSNSRTHGILYLSLFTLYTNGPSLLFPGALFADVPFQFANTLLQWTKLGLPGPNSYPNFFGGYFSLDALVHFMGIPRTELWEFPVFYSLLSIFIMAIMVYAISNSLLNDFRATLSPVLFLSLSWMWTNSLSTLSYGLILYVTVLVVSVLFLRGLRSSGILVLLCSFAMASASPEAPIYLFSLFLIWFILELLTKNWGLARRLSRLLLLTFIPYASWWLFVSYNGFTAGIMATLSTVLTNLHGLLLGRVGSIAVGRSVGTLEAASPLMKISNFLKYGITSMQLLLMLIGVYLFFRKRIRSYFFLAAISSGIPFAVVSSFSFGGYAEDIASVSLLGLVLFVPIMLKKSKRGLLVLVLVVMSTGALVMPLTRYSIAADSYFTPAEIQAPGIVAQYSNLFVIKPSYEGSTVMGPFYAGSRVTGFQLPIVFSKSTLLQIETSAKDLIANNYALVFDHLDYTNWVLEANAGDIYIALQANVTRSYNLVFNAGNWLLIPPKSP